MRSAAAWIIVAVIVMVAAAGSAHAQTVPGLCVSGQHNTTGDCNVVSNGVVQPEWAEGGWEFLLNIVQPQLFMTIDDPDAWNLTMPVTLTYNVEGDPAQQVALWSELTQSAEVTSDTETPLAFNATLNCASSGVSNFSITIDFGEGYTPLKIYFQKQCSLPHFDIATGIYGSNVVSNNVVNPSFEKYVLTGATNELIFYVYLSDEQEDSELGFQPFTLELSADLPAMLQVTPAADGTGWEGYAEKRKSVPNGSQIKAAFQCLQQPQLAVDVPVYAVLRFEWTTSLYMKFHYRCGNPLPLAGLQIGTVAGLSDVAADGLALPPWNRTKVFSPDAFVDFPLFIVSTQQNNVPYDVVLFSDDESVLQVNATSPLSGVLAWAADGTPVPTPFLSTVLCVSAGNTRVHLQLVLTMYDPVTIQFLYTCDEPLFNVGTTPGGSEVLQRSQVNPSFKQHLLPNVQQQSLYVLLDFGNVADSNPFQIEAVPEESNALRVTVDAGGLHGNATKDAARSAANPVVLHFECTPCVTTHSSKVAVTFFWGWTQTVSVNIYKDCLADKAQCGGGPSGGGKHGMSGAGIAALVIFLLSFAACVAGCGYNRFALHRRGWAVVPGGASAAAWFDRVSTGGRATKWSPQESDGEAYSRHADERGAIGAAAGGYTSYASNL